MVKFTLIQESYNLGRFSITRDQFITYRKTIENILLNEMYPNNVKVVDGIPLLTSLDCEKKENRDFSIFHKINTNVTVMKYLVKTFNLSNFNDLIELVVTRKNDLFIEGTVYFNEIHKILKITEEYGDRNELLSISYIKDVIKRKLNLDISPIKSPTGSYDDLINGIDIKFNLNGRDFTCQVKPLVSISEIGNNCVINSSGNIKNYKTDYLSFADHRTSKVILFQNKEVSISGNIITIPKKYLVV